MTEIMLVRHGETSLNVAEVFRGRLDVPLDETGLRQAALLADYLGEGGQEVAAVYCSPLRRALHTAEPLAARCGLELRIEPRLIDLDFGQWQGLSHQEVREKFQEVYQIWREHPEQVVLPGGEGLADVRTRAISVVDEVMAQYTGKVVLVTHRVVNKILICALLGLDNSHFWNIQQDTCGITSFVFSGGSFILTRHNDTAHLRLLRGARLSDF